MLSGCHVVAYFKSFPAISVFYNYNVGTVRGASSRLQWLGNGKLL